MRRLRRLRRGNNAIEFALGAVTLLVLTGAVADWGWYMRSQLIVSNAAREGARAAAGTDQRDDPETTGVAFATSLLTDAGLPPQLGDVTATQTRLDPDGVVEVSVSVAYTPLVSLVPTPPQLSAATTMRMEDQP